MISIRRFVYFAALVAGISNTLSCAAQQAEQIHATYEGSTPCGTMPRSFLKIPVKDSCEFVKWQFTFYSAPAPDKPARFTMKAVYGLTQPNTQGFSKSSNYETSGVWSIQKGITSNPDAIIYRLVTTGNDSLSFIALNSEMLHPLDAAGRLMIGNAGWSYTLSSTEKGFKK